MDIISSLLSILTSEDRAMLATIISASGSTPASALSKMIITNEGKNSIGTVGGGCMEGDVLHGAKDLFPRNKAAVMTFHLNEDEMIQGLICGGTVNILLEPVGQESRQLYEELRQIRDNGDDCIVATHVTSTGEIRFKSVVRGDSLGRRNPIGDYLNTAKSSADFHTDQLQKVLHRAETRMISLPDGQLILEPVFGRPQLVLFGGGHVSRYLSRTASMAGFRVTVVDDRAQYANPERFPEADATVIAEFYNSLERMEIKDSTYIVIVTRGHRSDEEILEQVIRTPAKYIGMIGSARKVLTTYEHLLERGVTRDQLKRVHAPMGLEIGAATAEEIAVSVAAELIQVRRNAGPPAENKSTLLNRLRNNTHHDERRCIFYSREESIIMTPKTKRVVDIAATVVPCALVLVSGTMKFTLDEQVVQGFTALGVIQYLPILGLAEICFALLFIPRKTMKLGFILLSCYFAGAMATELSHGMMPASPTTTLVIIWIGAFVRDKSIFFSSVDAKA